MGDLEMTLGMLKLMSNLLYVNCVYVRMRAVHFGLHILVHSQ